MSSDFTFTSIGSACEISTGFPFKSNDYCAKSESIKLLRGDNIAQGTLRWDGVKRWNPEELEPSVESKYLLRSGDVVVAMDRPWIEAGLKFAAIQESDLPCLLVQRVACLRAGESIDQGFLKYVVSDYAFTTHVLAVQTGTAVPHISSKQIAEYEFAAPPIPEQKAIAHILGTLDDKIELNRKTNETLEAMAKALFKSWFMDFDPVRAKAEGRPTGLPAEISDLFPDSFEDSELGDIPSGWQVQELGEISTISGGKQLEAGKLMSKGRFPVYGANGVMGFHDQTTHDSFVIVFGRVGAYCGSVKWEYGGAWVNNNASSVIPLKNEELVLQSMLEADFSNYRTGSAQPFIPNGALASSPVLMPTDAVATLFCDSIKSIRLNQKQNESIVLSLVEIRDALLPKLISGEIRIPDAQKMLEEVVI